MTELPRDRLDDMVKKAARIKDQIDDLQYQLEAVTEQYNFIVRDTIPDIMAEMGIEKAVMGDGTAVSLSLSVHPSIASPAAFEWLDMNGYGGIIKTQCALSFSRSEREEANALIEKLAELGYETELKETVHPMTLKSWAKERIEAAEPVPADLITINAFTEAKLKKGKVK
jgi:hypothetical protein